MKRMRARCSFAGALLFLAGCCFADTTTLTFPALQIKQSGFVALDGGQIVQGTNDANHKTLGAQGASIGKLWMEDLLFQYANECIVTERMRVALSIQCQINYCFPYSENASLDTKQPQITFIPDRAEGMYTIGNFQKPTLQFGFGYFPFKTDPDAKNLGDYLFRTGTYPVFVINTFDRCNARLLGLRVTSNLFDGFHQDLLLTSSTLLPPLGDGTLTYLAGYSFDKILEIGGGVSFVSLFPVDNQLTTPTSQSTTAYIKQNGDTAYYTFAATKPMARFAFDPKPLIPADLIPGNLLGKDDFRLYGEACVTAWEDYVNYDTSVYAKEISYANRNDRTLFMAGFDFPTFKTMDVLSIEVEHYPNKYPNDDNNLVGGSWQPLPYPVITGPNDAALTNVYPWFWSVYAKKTFLDRFSIIAQFARDHMRPFNNDQQSPYTGDVSERKGDWWWNVRLKASF